MDEKRVAELFKQLSLAQKNEVGQGDMGRFPQPGAPQPMMDPKILNAIFSNMPKEEAAAMRQVCKQWNDCVGQNKQK